MESTWARLWFRRIHVAISLAFVDVDRGARGRGVVDRTDIASDGGGVERRRDGNRGLSGAGRSKMRNTRVEGPGGSEIRGPNGQKSWMLWTVCRGSSKGVWEM